MAEYGRLYQRHRLILDRKAQLEGELEGLRSYVWGLRRMMRIGYEMDGPSLSLGGTPDRGRIDGGAAAGMLLGTGKAAGPIALATADVGAKAGPVGLLCDADGGRSPEKAPLGAGGRFEESAKFVDSGARLRRRSRCR